jgi:hypothetical protein
MATKGNWKRVIKKLETFQEALEAKLLQTTEQAAMLVEDTALGHLKNQDLGWAPLTGPYLRKKKRTQKQAGKSLSEKILIATATYFRSIASYVDGLKAFIGVKRGVAREKDGGTDVVDIAAVHEEPITSPVPKRALWKPTFEETKPEVLKMYKQALHEVTNR